MTDPYEKFNEYKKKRGDEFLKYYAAANEEVEKISLQIDGIKFSSKVLKEKIGVLIQKANKIGKELVKEKAKAKQDIDDWREYND